MLVKKLGNSTSQGLGESPEIAPLEKTEWGTLAFSIITENDIRKWS